MIKKKQENNNMSEMKDTYECREWRSLDGGGKDINIARITIAALHKSPEKSSLNVCLSSQTGLSCLSSVS